MGPAPLFPFPTQLLLGNGAKYFILLSTSLTLPNWKCFAPSFGVVLGKYTSCFLVPTTWCQCKQFNVYCICKVQSSHVMEMSPWSSQQETTHIGTNAMAFFIRLTPTTTNCPHTLCLCVLMEVGFGDGSCFDLMQMQMGQSSNGIFLPTVSYKSCFIWFLKNSCCSEVTLLLCTLLGSLLTLCIHSSSGKIK